MTKQDEEYEEGKPYSHEEEGYIVEFIRIGQAMKVTAIDMVSLREVSMVGNPKMPRHYLTKIAIDKLRYVLEKEKTANE